VRSRQRPHGRSKIAPHKRPALDGPQPLVVKPRAAERLLSCSHKRLYELLNAGELESFRDGASRKITLKSIEAYILRQLAKGCAMGRGVGQGSEASL
jgi:hypothetical protein